MSHAMAHAMGGLSSDVLGATTGGAYRMLSRIPLRM